MSAPCRHIWFSKGKDVIAVVNGLVTTKYTHKCPKCGKVKVTVRASRKLPDEVRLKRELEKLVERAAAEGYRYENLVLENVNIIKCNDCTNT